MKFLPPLLLCACFIYAGNGIAAPSGAAGIDAPTKTKHASFILELDANVAVLKNLDGEIYAGLDNGKRAKFCRRTKFCRSKFCRKHKFRCACAAEFQCESKRKFHGRFHRKFRCRKFFRKFREAKSCREFYDIKFRLKFRIGRNIQNANFRPALVQKLPRRADGRYHIRRR